ncbi:MAG: hypothetical protein HOP28_12715 [Gemmatimonadales bacterium]|nr:hypothetical protein [Gemmatimonadales bacterium]
MDSGDRAQILKVALPTVVACTVMGVAVAFFLMAKGQIGLGGGVVVALLGPLAGIGLAAAIWRGAGLASRSFVSMVSGGGNIKPAPSFSFEESLIARGKYAEAGESLDRRLAETPSDNQIRLVLASLVRDHLRDPARAERLFLEARRREPSADQEFAIANALIDLYRATEQAGREMSELARFADRYRGTDAGTRARQALTRLKESAG